MDFVKRNPIVTLVTVVYVIGLYVSNKVCNFLRDFSKLMIQLVITHIEDFSGDDIRRRFQTGYECSSGIINVQKRPPLSSVEDCNLTCDSRLGGQEIDYQIQSRPG